MLKPHEFPRLKLPTRNRGSSNIVQKMKPWLIHRMARLTPHITRARHAIRHRQSNPIFLVAQPAKSFSVVEPAEPKAGVVLKASAFRLSASRRPIVRSEARKGSWAKVLL
jgi:hypothetical protein